MLRTDIFIPAIFFEADESTSDSNWCNNWYDGNLKGARKGTCGEAIGGEKRRRKGEKRGREKRRRERTVVVRSGALTLFQKARRRRKNIWGCAPGAQRRLPSAKRGAPDSPGDRSCMYGSLHEMVPIV